MPKKFNNLNARGIGVIELIIVITIISILIFIVYYYFQDLSKRARDAARLADLANMQQAITLALHDSNNKLDYTLCSSVVIPCKGTSFPLTKQTQNTNGSGWLKVNFEESNSANFVKLPVDPINDALFHYDYYSDGLLWKITSSLESKQYKQKMSEDGGIDPNSYEVIVKVDRPKISRPAAAL